MPKYSMRAPKNLDEYVDGDAAIAFFEACAAGIRRRQKSCPEHQFKVTVNERYWCERCFRRSELPEGK